MVAPDQVFHDSYNHVYHPTTGYGGAPKAAQRWYGYLVGNLSATNYEAAAYSAGVISHYVADVANPLHTDSSDAEDAIHSKYETEVTQHLSQITVSVVELDTIVDVSAYVVSIAESSHGYYWALVNNYTQSGWNTDVDYITETCLSMAVKATASLWNSAIQSSGPSSPPTTTTTSAPPPTTTRFQVVINEVEQNPPGDDAGNEWVELYNPTANAVDIRDWTVSTTAGRAVTVTISSGTRIASGGYYIVTYGSQWLDNEGESVVLRGSGGNEVDRTPSLTDTKNDGRSWQRYPNGQDTDSISDWSFQTSTRGFSNGGELVPTPTTTTTTPPPTTTTTATQPPTTTTTQPPTTTITATPPPTTTSTTTTTPPATTTPPTTATTMTTLPTATPAGLGTTDLAIIMAIIVVMVAVTAVSIRWKRPAPP